MSFLKKTDPVEELSRLQQSFKLKLSAKVDEIKACWISIKNEASPDFHDFHLKIHSLAGTSGTFSALKVSNVSREIEAVIKLLMNKEISLNKEIIEQIDFLIAELHRVAEKWQPTSIPNTLNATYEEKAEESLWNSNIYLVEDDVEIVRPLIEFLENEGYKVFYYREIDEFENAYHSRERASAIIMDMAFKEGHIAGSESIKRLSEKDENFPPVVFISVHEDIQARLAAAQVGARRYFTKPINQKNLLASLDNLTNRRRRDAYKILLIDDEQGILDYYSTILQQHDIETLCFTSPLEGYQAIDSFKPDLIVMDLYMPECSGLDLAKVIRQNDEYAHIPIVFLSSELDIGTQLSAINLGGDDFLMKPVEPEHFIQAMMARVKRSRRISRLNKTLQNTLRESEYRLVSLDRHAIVIMTDVEGTITYVNEHFLKLTSFYESEILGKNYRFVEEKKYDEIWKVISDGKIWNGQVCNRKKDNDKYWLEMTAVPFIDEKGAPYKYVFAGTDVSQIKKTEIALIEAKEEAERANCAKSDFLSRMSHELRTPMNAISGFAQLLKMNCEDSANQVQLDNIEEILNASNHLLSLINETLNLSEIESGNISLTYEKVSFSEVLNDCLSLIKPLSEDRNISFEFMYDHDVILLDNLKNSDAYIKADRKRFKQVLLNILSNAIKYNIENGKVIIDYEEIDDLYLRISITDTGKGIASDLLPQLFTEFSRLGVKDSMIEGTGIGLMITKTLTELMSGELGVKSEVDKGSTFWLEFPLYSQ